jgi:hypothetical protein
MHSFANSFCLISLTAFTLVRTLAANGLALHNAATLHLPPGTYTMVVSPQGLVLAPTSTIISTTTITPTPTAITTSLMGSETTITDSCLIAQTALINSMQSYYESQSSTSEVVRSAEKLLQDVSTSTATTTIAEDVSTTTTFMPVAASTTTTTLSSMPDPVSTTTTTMTMAETVSTTTMTMAVVSEAAADTTTTTMAEAVSTATTTMTAMVMPDSMDSGMAGAPMTTVTITMESGVAETGIPVVVAGMAGALGAAAWIF